MSLRAFLLGLTVWTASAVVGSAAFTVIDDYTSNEFTDWNKLRRTSAGMALIGAGGYYRKHRALLKLPPYLE